MKRAMLALALMVPGAAGASLPPPPPAFVEAAQDAILAADPVAPAYKSLFAPDLIVEENGKPIARGPDQWLRLARPAKGVLGVAKGWAGRGGTLLIVESADSVRRDDLPPGAIADPRPRTRAARYDFGADGKVHRIAISSVDGRFEAARR
ncbi:MAG: hypothetical protein A4S12_01045 [Proteobacteria bacterium SG_bin5]|nr:hypothetical protein [Sphingomonas sp.]OQW42254.1 MAG: hypothetical protein A4S12_01045 [Proteobacteria bacterium SG_bin5]